MRRGWAVCRVRVASGSTRCVPTLATNPAHTPPFPSLPAWPRPWARRPRVAKSSWPPSSRPRGRGGRQSCCAPSSGERKRGLGGAAEAGGAGPPTTVFPVVGCTACAVHTHAPQPRPLPTPPPRLVPGRTEMAWTTTSGSTRSPAPALRGSTCPPWRWRAWRRGGASGRACVRRAGVRPSKPPTTTKSLPQSVIELSRTQDEEVGDGTTSVIILGAPSVPFVSHRFAGLESLSTRRVRRRGGHRPNHPLPTHLSPIHHSWRAAGGGGDLPGAPHAPDRRHPGLHSCARNRAGCRAPGGV